MAERFEVRRIVWKDGAAQPPNASVERSLGAGTELIDHEAGTRAITLDLGLNAVSLRAPIRGVSREFLHAEAGFPGGDTRATGNGTPILAPFPNRIRGGRFSWRGRAYHLPCNERGGANAIHGFVFDRVWNPPRFGVDERGAWLVGEFDLARDEPAAASVWPGGMRLTVEYRLCGDTLASVFTVTNDGPTTSVPFGLGTHPYFRFPMDGSAETDCLIESPCAEHVELVDCLPTGSIAPVPPDRDLRRPATWAGRQPDDVYTGVSADPDGLVRHRLIDRRAGAELVLSHDASFGWIVVYIPPHRRGICIEPYTCCTDAVNGTGRLAEGLIDLGAGASRRFRIDTTVRELAG
jgi:aldose 1-epimerase